MSLVPILYTALLIFILFSIIIVLVSYVSYRVRQRNTREEENNETSYYKTYYAQPNTEIAAKSYSNSIKVVSTIKKPDERKTVELPYYHNYRQNTPAQSSKYYTSERGKSSYTDAQPYSKSSTNYPVYERDTDHQYENENNVKSYQYIPRTRTNPGQSRIEILNKLPLNKKEDDSKERYHTSGSGHVALPKYFAGFQAISYYSEENDDSFFKASQNTKE